MTTNKNASSSAVASLRLFGNIRVLVISALFIAMSIALGKLLAFNVTPYIRISFENLTIIMAGIFFGPFVGAAVGAGADIIGCILVGYSINPIITLGAASIGLVAGIVSSSVFKGNVKLNTAFSVGLAHLIGSVIIKSIGLRVYYNYPIGWLAWRLPTYIGIGILEFYIIWLLLNNKAFSEQLDKVRKNGRNSA